jgi:hypothetical protein
MDVDAIGTIEMSMGGPRIGLCTCSQLVLVETRVLPERGRRL